jgi:hypothetical protein
MIVQNFSQTFHAQDFKKEALMNLSQEIQNSGEANTSKFQFEPTNGLLFFDCIGQ